MSIIIKMSLITLEKPWNCSQSVCLHLSLLLQSWEAWAFHAGSSPISTQPTTTQGTWRLSSSLSQTAHRTDATPGTPSGQLKRLSGIKMSCLLKFVFHTHGTNRQKHQIIADHYDIILTCTVYVIWKNEVLGRRCVLTCLSAGTTTAGVKPSWSALIFHQSTPDGRWWTPHHRRPATVEIWFAVNATFTTANRGSKCSLECFNACTLS